MASMTSMKRVSLLVLLLASLCAVIRAQTPRAAVRVTPEQMSQITTDYTALQKELKELQAQQEKLQETVQKLRALEASMTSLLPRVRAWETRVDAAGGNSQSQLLAATKELQEMNQSVKSQYLQMQNAMQNENRKFTMLSNIMKTKHDTAKNAISNVR